MTRPLLAAAAVVAAALYGLGLLDGAPGLRLAIKPIPVLVMAWWVARGPRGRDPYGARVCLGLLACAVGDVLLDISFVAGMLAFFLGHALYIAAYTHAARRPAPLRALPFALWGVLTYRALAPGLGALAIPVAVYTIAICGMLWRAAVRLRLGPPRSRDALEADALERRSAWLAFAGAVLFATSDTLIALNRFHAPIAHARYPIIALYWLGQLGICRSALARANQRAALTSTPASSASLR